MITHIENDYHTRMDYKIKLYVINFYFCFLYQNVCDTIVFIIYYGVY